MKRVVTQSPLMILCVCAILSACTSSTTPRPNDALAPGSSGNGSRISVCKVTDTQVDSSQQCLQDDAACYELSNGKWCTGERGNTCPAGSTALPTGVPCAPGKRCIRIGESLECSIN